MRYKLNNDKPNFFFKNLASKIKVLGSDPTIPDAHARLPGSAAGGLLEAT